MARASSNSTVRISSGLYDQISLLATGTVSNYRPFKTAAVKRIIANIFTTIFEAFISWPPLIILRQIKRPLFYLMLLLRKSIKRLLNVFIEHSQDFDVPVLK